MINSPAIEKLLRPSIHTIMGQSKMYDAQWKEWFSEHTSKLAVEYDVEMKYLGYAQQVSEGAAYPVDDMGQRNTYTYVHKNVGLGFVITKNALADNQYKSQFPMMAISLKNTMQQTKDVIAAAIFNNGTNALFPIGDGQPLFSLYHPIDTGVVANRPTIGMDLNEASLEAGLIGIQEFRNHAGLKTMNNAKKLLISKELQYVAERLTKSEYRPGTNTNDINAIRSMGAIPNGYRVNQFIELPGFWMIGTDATNAFKHYKRQEMETSVYTDPFTNNMHCKAEERYSFGVSDFKGGWSSEGAA